MVLMSFEVGERSKTGTSTKLLKCLKFFGDFPTFYRLSLQSWTRMNRVQSKRKKSAPFYVFFLHVSQRLFQQVFAKWERNARNPESKSRQIVLFWLELSTSLSTLPITLLRHTPPSAAHVVEKTFATARRIEKKKKKKNQDFTFFIKRWDDDKMIALTCSAITVAWRLVLFICKRLVKAIFFPSPDRLKQIFRSSKAVSIS